MYGAITLQWLRWLLWKADISLQRRLSGDLSRSRSALVCAGTASSELASRSGMVMAKCSSAAAIAHAVTGGYDPADVLFFCGCSLSKELPQMQTQQWYLGCTEHSIFGWFCADYILQAPCLWSDSVWRLEFKLGGRGLRVRGCTVEASIITNVVIPYSQHSSSIVHLKYTSK